MLETLVSAGPDALLELKARYLVPCVYHFYDDPPQIVAADGCTLIDHLGRTYIDCYAGVTVMSAGHCNEMIIEPAIAQIRTLQHTTTIYLTEPVLRLAGALAAITPGDLTRSFFCVSGSEAVEGALHLAALHTDRPEIVAMSGSLHGRTRWALAATGLPMWRTDPFPLHGVHRAAYGDIDRLRSILQRHGHTIGAVIAEPVQGNGGIVVPDDTYWPAVRRLCDEHGVLLIFDEVQSGFNRTGRWFACEHWNVTPDIMAVSKALGNGFPIAAFITTDEIAACCTKPGASTHGGNPVAATAALATIDFHREHDLGGRAASRGRRLLSGLRRFAGRPESSLGPPRGLGLMIGVPVVDRDGGPDADRCNRLLESLKDNGVLAGKTGPDRNVLAFMPPLVISEGEIDQVLTALGGAIDEID